MTTYDPERLKKAKLLALFEQPTLEVVIRRLKEDEALPAKKKGDYVSALRRIAVVLGLPPGAIPAQPQWLQRELCKVAPARFGITSKTWSNILSNGLSALKKAGVSTASFRRMPLRPDWQALYETLTSQHLRVALGRFMAFCSRTEVDPERVSDEVVAEFARALTEASLRKRPDLALYYLTSGWNKAVDLFPTWPRIKLSVPNRRVVIAIPFNNFPASLQADVTRYLEVMGSINLLLDEAPHRRLAPKTLEHRLIFLRRFVGYLLISGIEIKTLRDLRAVVEPGMAKRGLQEMLKRQGERKSSTIFVAACILTSIAKHHARLPKKQLDELNALCKRLRPRRTGMTAKNRERLRKFDDQGNVDALLLLPQDLLKEARKGSRSSKAAARLVEIALAVELLLATVLRIKNLASLHLKKNFDRTRATKEGVYHLVVDAADVKNHESLEFELEPETADLLTTFLERYRPALVPSGSPWLFACRDGSGPVDPVVLARRITGTIRKRIGLDVNPHLFRAIVGKLHLDEHPGQYEVLRRLYGHKRLSTVMSDYTGLEAVSAAKHVDRTIRKLRKSAEERPRPRRPSR